MKLMKLPCLVQSEGGRHMLNGQEIEIPEVGEDAFELLQGSSLCSVSYLFNSVICPHASGPLVEAVNAINEKHGAAVVKLASTRRLEKVFPGRHSGFEECAGVQAYDDGYRWGAYRLIYPKCRSWDRCNCYRVEKSKATLIRSHCGPATEAVPLQGNDLAIDLARQDFPDAGKMCQHQLLLNVFWTNPKTV